MNELVFLVVLILSSTSSSWVFNYHEMESLTICQECVENAKIAIPKGGDAEAAIVMYCTTSKVKAWSNQKKYK